jgi:hypothetical protein
MKKFFLLLIGLNLLGLSINAQTAVLYIPGNLHDVSSNSYVGIGTSTPAQLLHVKGSACIKDNLGIGTTAPLARLHVVEPSFNAVEAYSNDGNTAIVGTSTNSRGAAGNYTHGVEGFAYNGVTTSRGVYGYSLGNTYTTNSYGVYGEAPSSNAYDFGGYFTGEDYGLEASGGIFAGIFNGHLKVYDGNLLLTNSGTANELRFSNGSYYTAIKAPTQTSNITFKLPLGVGTSNQVLSTDGNNPATLSWITPSAGSITQVGSMTSSVVFANSNADDQWLGLGPSSGRIAFDDDQTNNVVNILDAYVGIGSTGPIARLYVEEPTYNALEAKSLNGNSAIVGTSIYNGDNNYTAGVEGYSYLGESYNYGVKGYVEAEYNATAPVYNYGVYGEAAMTEYGTQYGGYFIAYGTDGNKIGVYATIAGGTNNEFAGLFDGDLHYTGIFSGPSDRKLKENISDISSALDLIKKLEPREFTFKKSPEFNMLNLPKGKNFGFIAQELETVLPELVTDVVHPPQLDKNGKVRNEGLSYKAVNYISFIPILTQSIKEQQLIIDNQSIKIEEMEKEINNIKSQLGLKDVLNKAILSPVLNNIAEKQTALFQNNPNPFSVETSIEFNIAEQFGTASLCVYNLQGTQLKKYDLQSNGKGKITIHANEFVAGIYLYTLLVDNKEIATKRMILTQ